MKFAVDFPGLAWLALLAPVIAAAAFAWQHRRRLKRINALGGEAAVARLAPAGIRRPPVARAVRLSGALALATFGLAGPRWGSGTQVVRQRGLDVAIAMDASLSMLAEDERPSRLQRMRQEVRRYRASSPGDRNALIAFAGKSYILTPLTTDDGAIELLLDNFDPNLVGLAGTALAPTIIQGTQLLQAANGSASRALVILSDGEAFDDHDAALAAAREAKRAGISIITVGFGTTDGSTIPIRETGGELAKRDENGQIVITKYDPELLQRVADASGGEFVAATEGDRGGRITQALARLDAEQRDVEEGLSRPLRISWFLVPALLLLLLDAWRIDGGNWNRVRRVLRLAVPALLVALLAHRVEAQSAARLYDEGRFAEAAARWRVAINKGDSRAATLYDLGTALLAADSLGTAEEALERAAATPETRLRRLALYNLGLARLRRAMKPEEPERQRAADAALSTYRTLLQEQPGDADAKWNYELALRVKRSESSGGQREQPQRQPQQDQTQQQKQDPQMSRQQAEQLLAAASRDERDTQARKQAGNRTQRPPGGKEW
ncbi:MAG: VWA domain-containing protein [Gemmatimonadota bacterium]|nr:VWA domain-containing protein [Gemmatimonadota bacterium]